MFEILSNAVVNKPIPKYAPIPHNRTPEPTTEPIWETPLLYTGRSLAVFRFVALIESVQSLTN